MNYSTKPLSDMTDAQLGVRCFLLALITAAHRESKDKDFEWANSALAESAAEVNRRFPKEVTP